MEHSGLHDSTRRQSRVRRLSQSHPHKSAKNKQFKDRKKGNPKGFFASFRYHQKATTKPTRARGAEILKLGLLKLSMVSSESGTNNQSDPTQSSFSVQGPTASISQDVENWLDLQQLTERTNDNGGAAYVDVPQSASPYTFAGNYLFFHSSIHPPQTSDLPKAPYAPCHLQSQDTRFGSSEFTFHNELNVSHPPPPPPNWVGPPFRNRSNISHLPPPPPPPDWVGPPFHNGPQVFNPPRPLVEGFCGKQPSSVIGPDGKVNINHQFGRGPCSSTDHEICLRRRQA